MPSNWTDLRGAIKSIRTKLIFKSKDIYLTNVLNTSNVHPLIVS